jgi:hypothetical protein
VILQALPLPDSDGTCKIVLRPPKDDKNDQHDRDMAGHTHEPPVQHLAAFSSDREGLTLNLLIQYSHAKTFIHRVPLGDHHFNFCLVGHIASLCDGKTTDGHLQSMLDWNLLGALSLMVMNWCFPAFLQNAGDRLEVVPAPKPSTPLYQLLRRVAEGNEPESI